MYLNQSQYIYIFIIYIYICIFIYFYVIYHTHTTFLLFFKLPCAPIQGSNGMATCMAPPWPSQRRSGFNSERHTALARMRERQGNLGNFGESNKLKGKKTGDLCWYGSRFVGNIFSYSQQIHVLNGGWHDVFVCLLYVTFEIYVIHIQFNWFQ